MDTHNRSMEYERLLPIFWGQHQVAGSVPGPEIAKEFALNWTVDKSDATETFAFIQNPDGSIRWLFQASISDPVYLSLYNSANIKAWVYKLISHFAFKLGLQKRLYNGQVGISGWRQSPLYNLLEEIPHDHFAIFTGTAGENRKSIVALSIENHTSHFIKIPQTPSSLRLCQNEFQILQRLNAYPFSVLKIPKALQAKHLDALILSNVKTPTCRESAYMEELHLKALAELYVGFSRTEFWENSAFAEGIYRAITDMKALKIQDPTLNADQVDHLIQLLERGFQKFEPDYPLMTALAHCDFTSWNLYISEEAIHVYDWELAREGMPLFYDIFHFLYQSGILLQKMPYKGIQRQFMRVQRLPAMRKLLVKFPVIIADYQLMYLLHIVSYYLPIYMKEPKVHMQVHWLLNTWEEALTHQIQD